MDVGKRITELKKIKNLTTNKLANKAGISQSYLRNVELGLVNPTIEKLEYICEVLDISLKDFFTEDSIQNPSIEQILKTFDKDQLDQLINFINLLKKAWFSCFIFL